MILTFENRNFEFLTSVFCLLRVIDHNVVSDEKYVKDESQFNSQDSQLLFNIEALKIAKQARDQQDTANYKPRKKIKPTFFLSKLRKFKSLPNLSLLKNIALKKIRSRTGEWITLR